MGKPSRTSKPASNELSGSNNNDTLDAAGGDYLLKGGAGDDLYIIDGPLDQVEERRNRGTDTVLSSIDYTLGDNVENLTLEGTDNLSGTGNELDNVLTGNLGDNLLDGLSGNDTIFGLDGNDTLLGGSGDDLLSGGAGADVIDGGTGTDIAVFGANYASYSFELTGGLILVTDTDGNTDTLSNIETLRFADFDIAASEVVATPVPVALAPADDTAIVAEDGAVAIDVMGNDAGDGLTLSSVANGLSGTVTQNADGSITYRPFADFHGTDSFDYTVTDAAGNSASATVNVQVTSVNDAPLTSADSFAVTSGQTLSTGNVLSNDSDPDGDMLSVAGYDSTTTGGGSVTVNADGSFTYLSAADFAGQDSFTYSVTDGAGGSATETVTIDVAAPDPVVTDPAPEPAPEPAYYVTGLIGSNDYARLNYPGAVGSSVTVAYTFLDDVPSYISPNDPRGINETFQAFTAQQREVTRAALAEIEQMTGVTFVEVATPEEATMTFGIYDLGGSGLGTTGAPLGTSTGDFHSDIWIDTQAAGDSFIPGTEGYYVLLHETAHAMGLGHPDLPVLEENRKFTVMDYSAHPQVESDVTGYQLYDIAALQYLYGSGDGNADDTVYGFDDLNGIVESIWDAGGHDTLDLSGADFAVQLNLTAGSFSTVIDSGIDNFSLAYGTLIEDATGGAFDDTIIGNDADNAINGGGGNDSLTGGAGADSFVFESGWGQDTIGDFELGVDVIDLAQTGLVAGAVTISEVSGDTLVEADGQSILLAGISGLDVNDFLFA